MAKRVLNEKTGRTWIDLTGDTFGRWTVLECTGRLPTTNPLVQGATTWKCLCSCGRTKENVNYGALVGGTSLSCGCLRGEVLGLRAKKHGDSKAKAYRAWQQCRQRCFNPERACWNNYGGRGITVCQGFKESYETFRDALGECPSSKHSVDRKDNNGHYSCGSCPECLEKKWPLNIHWATQGEQNENKRSAIKFIWNGKLMSLTQIARLENVAYNTFRNKMVWETSSVRKALEYCRGRGLTFNERAQCVLERNPDAPTRPPNRRYSKRKKSVPNNPLTPVPIS
jgi:hypothetical protein